MSWCGSTWTAARSSARNACSEGELGRIRDVRVGPDGAIYALTDAGNGQVIRVAPEGV
ncbi:PQQ-dependent sugar dehydrogenase [Devosia sp. A8/3-2]|nr:PQQ-dependent sugar dehydrogenase [Devosia sp. A8/3-2]